MGENKRENEILEVNINEVIPNRFQPRLNFEDNSMQELSQSIIEHGIIQPLVVRRIADKYEIIAGERRYKAATMAALQTVPVIVVDLSDTESAEVALIENIQRKDLSPIEEAKSYQKIIDLGQITQEALAKRMGKSQSAIANKIRLLSLSQKVQESLMHNEISERHARSLLSIKDQNQQEEMLSRILNERLTVRKTDIAIDELLNRRSAAPDFANVESLESSAELPPMENSIPSPVPIISQPIPQPIEIPNAAPENNALNGLFDDGEEIPFLPGTQEKLSIAQSVVENDAMLKTDEEIISAQPPSSPPIAPSIMGSYYRSATTAILDLINNLQKYGAKVTAEEFDFENFYQINIKLDKK